VLLERAVLLLTGVCTELDPDLSPVEVIRPYLRDFVLGNRDWAQIALESARDMALQALTLPDDLKKFLTRANRGEGEVQIKNLPRAAALVYLGLRQLAYAAMSIAAGWAALDLYLAGHARLSEYCLVASAVMVVFFFVSISVTRTK
jgi:predicted unusual protein kinase regulating ubiquinone biosynthesis (AarF/ABC1/UbiB family)